jgi:hypothetical protein
MQEQAMLIILLTYEASADSSFALVSPGAVTAVLLEDKMESVKVGVRW